MFQVTIVEVGLREGLQSNRKILTLEEKIHIVDGCLAAGIRQIQLGSFVNPRRVPQMAGVEKLFDHYQQRRDATFSALVLNRRGLERAMDCGVRCINLSLSASNTHQKENTGRSIAEALPEILDMVSLAKDKGMHVRTGIQAAFGCYLEGWVPVERVVDMAKAFAQRGSDEINLADTAGFASPGSLSELLRAVRAEIPDTPIGLHLHNTLGMGLANVMAALHEGVTTFDSAITGLGGCPFMKGAEGNIATEDLVFLLQSLGAAKHINLSRLCEAASYVRDIYGSFFSGKICRHYDKLASLGLHGGNDE